MSNKQQTAVDFVVEELTKLGYLYPKKYGNSPKVQNVIKQAKAMEKEVESEQERIVETLKNRIRVLEKLVPKTNEIKNHDGHF